MFITLTRGQMTAKDKHAANTISPLFRVTQFFETPKILNSSVLRKAKSLKQFKLFKARSKKLSLKS